MDKGVLRESTLLLVFTSTQAEGGVLDLVKKQYKVSSPRNSDTTAEKTTVSHLIKVRHLRVDNTHQE